MELQGDRLIPAYAEATLRAAAGMPVAAPAMPAAARHNALWWLIGAAIVAAAIYFLMR
jgi:predicted cobalt transporter CbtA